MSEFVYVRMCSSESERFSTFTKGEASTSYASDFNGKFVEYDVYVYVRMFCS